MNRCCQALVTFFQCSALQFWQMWPICLPLTWPQSTVPPVAITNFSSQALQSSSVALLCVCMLYRSHLGPTTSPYFNFGGITNNNTCSQQLFKVPPLTFFTTSSPCCPNKSCESQNATCGCFKQDSVS